MALDFYSDEINENLAKLKPVQDVEPGVFDNFAKATGMATMKGFGEVARAGSMLQSVYPIIADKIMGGTTLQDRYFKWHDETFNSAVDYWTPRPNEVGVAGEVVGKLTSMLPLIMAGPGGVIAAIATTQLGTAEDLVRKHSDVSATQANVVGALQGAGLATGIWMPILGQNLVQRVVIGGAGFNVAQGVITRAASGAVLSDSKAAKEFEAFDGKALTIDILLGLAFGGIAHYVPSQRAQGAEAWAKISDWAKSLKPSDIDALLVLREGQHINEDSLPGKPATPEAVSIHVDRVRTAIDQLAGDRPVEVGAVPRETTFTTAKGSVYRVNDDGTTERDKAPRPEHPGDSGPQPRSDKTVYVTPEEAARLATPEGQWRVIDHGDGTVSIATLNPDGQWGIAPSARNVPVTDKPVAGLTPIELWAPEKINGLDAYGRVHFGNEITDVRQESMFKPDPAQILESERIAADMMEAARRVRMEEGLPRSPEVQTIPPKDITPLPPLEQAKAVGQHIERMLLETGMQTKEATANAAIWEAFAKSAYERYGIPPAELLTKYGVDVRRMDSADKLLGALEQRYNQINTPEFKRWFGDSKVVDAQGKPLVVYHGTGADITAFDNKKAPHGRDKNREGAFWFSTAPEVAGEFAGQQRGENVGGIQLGHSNILPVYLTIKNPFVDQFGEYAKGGGLTRDDIAALKAEGYDGVHWPQANIDLPDTTMQGPVQGYYRDRFGQAWGETERGYPDQWAAFDPEQIKSAIGNRGTFDPNNPNILFQGGVDRKLPLREMGDFKTGQPVTFEYIRRTERAPKPGPEDTFAQRVEPAGRYVIVKEIPNTPAGSESGTITFKNPLVIDYGEGLYTDKTNWKHVLSDAYGGKKGVVLSRAILADGYDGVVTLKPDHVSEIVDLSPVGQAAPREQLPKLSVIHNLTAENILFAAKKGGIAVPSLAIVKDGMGASGFGDITLIGKAHLADPRAEPVFDADAYSPRFPKPEYKKVKTAVAQKVVNEFRDVANEFDDHRLIDTIFDNAVNNPDPARSISDLVRSRGAQAKFLREKGVEVKPILRAKPVQFKWAKDEQFAADYSRLMKTLDADPRAPEGEVAVAQAELTQKAREAIDRFLTTEEGKKYIALYDGDVAQARAHAGTAWGLKGDWVTDKSIDIPYGFIYRIGDSVRDRGTIEVDGSATDKLIQEKMAGFESEFKSWIDNKIEPMYDEPFLKVAGKKRPYTLSHIVDAMTGPVRGREKTMSFGEGAARASVSRRFNDLEQMRKYAAENIMPETEVKAAREEARKLLEDWRNTVVNYYGAAGDGGRAQFGQVWEGLDASMKALARWAKGAKTEENMKRALAAEGFRTKEMSSFHFEDGVEAGKAWLKAPVPYFEAKPQRAVDFNEFAGAVVPSGTDSRVVDVLKKNGIEVMEYTKGDEQAQQMATDTLRKQLGAQGADVLFQDQPFYSQLTRSVEALKIAAAPAKGWKDTIKGLVSKGQVKQAEIEATGLNEWLDLQQGKVTKQQVQDYLAQNGVKVEEVMLEKKSLDIQAMKFSDIQNKNSVPGNSYVEPDEWVVIVNGKPVYTTAAASADEAIRLFKSDEAYDQLYMDGYPRLDMRGIPKYEAHQLPGGENYRELLLTLPQKRITTDDFVTIMPDGTPHGVFSTEAEAQRVAKKIGGTYEAGQSVGQEYPKFQSDHFSQPNILAHIRFNERTDADGKKVLFIEEIQSDWAQEGKKEGFAKPTPSDQEIIKLLDDAGYTARNNGVNWVVESKNGADVPNRLAGGKSKNQFASSLGQVAGMVLGNRELSSQFQISRPPAGPFVGKTEAWVALSLKRMIRYAAENGFDRVAWTTGEQQVARYNLSKQVDSINWAPHANDTTLVSVKMPGQNALQLAVNKSGKVDEARGPGFSQMVGKGLDEIIGKDVADMVLTEAKGELSGDGLKVGGKGMKAFYDKIVPNVANDVLKKLGGGRVGEVNLDVGGANRMAVAPRNDGTFSLINLDANVGSANEYTGSFATRAEGEAALKEMVNNKQAGFDITPALREKAMAGVPLFQGGARGSATSFSQTGQSLIHLFENANRSTFMHETGHVFLEMTRDMAMRDGVPVGAVQDWATLAKWLGIEGGPITREAHEKFARGWEKYLAEGVAPNEGLKGAFKRFRDWLIDIYKSLTNMDVELNNQIRGVMARMLDSQAKDPISKGGLEDPRLQDPEYRTALDMMARESGWAEEGGRIIRDPMTGEVSGRTQWIAHAEWYQRLQQDEKARLPGGRKGVQRAVQKAVMGEPMSIQEKRAVTFMLDEHKMLVDHWNESGANIHPDGDPFEIANLQHAEGIEPTANNTLDMALIDRARQVDPEAFENIPTNSDDATFMAAVKEIVDAHKPTPQKTDQGGEEAPTEAQTGHVDPQEPAAGSPPPPGGEATGGAAAPDMAAIEARRIATENPDMKVVVGKNSDGSNIYKSLNEILDEADLDARIAMDDINLITVAAECLMGVA